VLGCNSTAEFGAIKFWLGPNQQQVIL